MFPSFLLANGVMNTIGLIHVYIYAFAVFTVQGDPIDGFPAYPTRLSFHDPSS
jgi:hypothetical protein